MLNILNLFYRSRNAMLCLRPHFQAQNPLCSRGLSILGDNDMQEQSLYANIRQSYRKSKNADLKHYNSHVGGRHPPFIQHEYATDQVTRFEKMKRDFFHYNTKILLAGEDDADKGKYVRKFPNVMVESNDVSEKLRFSVEYKISRCTTLELPELMLETSKHYNPLYLNPNHHTNLSNAVRFNSDLRSKLVLIVPLYDYTINLSLLHKPVEINIIRVAEEDIVLIKYGLYTLMRIVSEDITAWCRENNMPIQDVKTRMILKYIDLCLDLSPVRLKSIFKSPISLATGVELDGTSLKDWGALHLEFYECIQYEKGN